MKDNLEEEINFKLDLDNYLSHNDTISSSSDTNIKPNTKSLRNKEIEKNWFAISEKEPTPAVLREWRSIQLRGFVDPKKFYKNTRSKLENIPKQFQLGTIVNKSYNYTEEDKVTNSNTNTTSFSKKKTRIRKKPTLITNTIKEGEKWVTKRYREIQTEKTSGRKGWYQRQLKKRKKI
ncbi:Fcf2 pre-rRNA processing family protein [Theileria parva strain Muguga]|uniref:Fcf2 pre-rRNA processing family protein n=1 Tax=Theileria parva strain Muguga TaxID=333668 RepID=UPI001C61E3F1|nr:Fcf2 pre-rRNA processing family protein [Theileria parva strain Muguga]KAF5153704.1 Fcf2 pre-rRNA processing family protein [Theileria parva strain Muguga]